MWIFLIVVVAISLTAVYFSPHGLRIIQQRRLRAYCASHRLLVLTYDDGPGNVTTPRLLDVLAAHGAKGTFYTVGKQIQSAPLVLSRLQSEGHEVASHSQSHLNAWKVAPWRSLLDVERGFATLASHGVSFKLFRPPYGKVNLLTWAAAAGRGIRFGWWTVVSGDTFTQLPDPASIVRTVENAGGGVVLMHDFDRGDERATYVMNLTQMLLEAAQVHNWTVCTQSQLWTFR